MYLSNTVKTTTFLLVGGRIDWLDVHVSDGWWLMCTNCNHFFFYPSPDRLSLQCCLLLISVASKLQSRVPGECRRRAPITRDLPWSSSSSTFTFILFGCQFLWHGAPLEHDDDGSCCLLVGGDSSSIASVQTIGLNKVSEPGRLYFFFCQPTTNGINPVPSSFDSPLVPTDRLYWLSRTGRRSSRAPPQK